MALNHRITWRSAAALALLLPLAIFIWSATKPLIGGARSTARPESTTLPVAMDPGPAAPKSSASLRVFARTEQRDSLQGTDVDGGVHRRADGHVIADRDLRRLFDYFLARLGERPLAGLRADLAEWLGLRGDLNADACTEVLALFDRYVATQMSAAALDRSQDLAADLQILATLRRDQLGPALAEAWFGEEERYARETLQRLALERDAALTTADRDDARLELDAARDAEALMQQRTTTDFQLAVLQSEQLASAGAGAQQRARARAELWGDEAAERLAQLDRQEAEWNARLAAYARARASLLADSTISEVVRSQRLNELLKGFSESERRRVIALTAAGLLPAA